MGFIFGVMLSAITVTLVLSHWENECERQWDVYRCEMSITFHPVATEVSQ